MKAKKQNRSCYGVGRGCRRATVADVFIRMCEDTTLTPLKINLIRGREMRGNNGGVNQTQAQCHNEAPLQITYANKMLFENCEIYTLHLASFMSIAIVRYSKGRPTLSVRVTSVTRPQGC
jgi:hypothetical protein